MKWVITYGSGFLDKVSKMSDLKVLNQIVMRCNKSSMVWHNDQTEKGLICEQIKLNPITFDKCLARLVESEVLIRIFKGKYMVNTKYITFGREVND